ncbi:MAG: hypothetical protein ABSH30_06375 [Acidimicrobiales bacterium]
MTLKCQGAFAWRSSLSSDSWLSPLAAGSLGGGAGGFLLAAGTSPAAGLAVRGFLPAAGRSLPPRAGAVGRLSPAGTSLAAGLGAGGFLLAAGTSPAAGLGLRASPSGGPGSPGDRDDKLTPAGRRAGGR